jgi:hypothetical protein
MNMNIDVRHVLQAIRVPTLVMNRLGDDPEIVARAQSRISSPAPGSSSRHAARAELKGVPGEWRLFAVSSAP